MGFARLALVISSLAPLYVLWGLRGIPSIPDFWLWVGITSIIVFSYGILFARIQVARSHGDRKMLEIGDTTDHREHLLTYLVANLLPLYDANVGNLREVYAMFVAYLFIVFLFWHMNLHYMNPLFAFCGYRIFSVQSPGAPEACFVVITKKPYLKKGSTVQPLRLSNTVYFDDEKQNAKFQSSGDH